MRAPLCIIIPTLNAAEALPGCAAALIEGLQSGLVRELVISDGGSDDATLRIAGDLGARIVEGPAGRGGQLCRGAEFGAAPWLLFVHSDTHLAPGWAAAVQHHIRTSRRAGYFRLRYRATGLAPRLVAAWVNLRSRLGLPYGDQGLLISRKLYRRLGGFRDISLMEDVAMSRALRGRLVMLPATALTSAHSYQRDGWLRRGAGNLWLLARYFAGADPEKLARRYRR